MNTAEKLRFLADRAEDGKEFMMEGYYCKYVFEENKIKMVDYMGHEVIVNPELLYKEFSLVPRHSFTDDELAILRNIPKEYEWIGRRKNTKLVAISPEKSIYDFSLSKQFDLSIFNNLFQSVQYEYSTNVVIDDYVERREEWLKLFTGHRKDTTLTKDYPYNQEV